jgi:hypothetical protein
MEKETNYTSQEKEIILAIIDMEISKARSQVDRAVNEVEFWEQLRRKFDGGTTPL